MSIQDKDKYSYHYPHYLEWERASWVVQVGDRIKHKDKVYKVLQVSRSPVPGSVPVVYIEVDE